MYEIRYSGWPSGHDTMGGGPPVVVVVSGGTRIELNPGPSFKYSCDKKPNVDKLIVQKIHENIMEVQKIHENIM